jgi:predicted lipoprotein with Yx(FWY)xxD motif
VSRSRSITFLSIAAAALLSAVALAACGGGGGGGNAATAAPAANKSAAGHTVKVRVANNPKLGRILVDSQGHTLYMFNKDKGTKSECTGACAKAWPPLRASGKPAAGSGVEASKLGTTKRSDGKPQVTYNRHPLYTFVKDTKAGQTNGEGLTAFGGSWFALSAAGNENAPAAPPAPKAPAAPAPKPPPAPPAPPAPTNPPSSSNGIPQNNGGDHDSDNNGGPSDGDGGI